MRNPWLSAWLRGANQAAGWWRGKALAEAGRQRARAVRQLFAAKPAAPKAPRRKPR